MPSPKTVLGPPLSRDPQYLWFRSQPEYFRSLYREIPEYSDQFVDQMFSTAVGGKFREQAAYMMDRDFPFMHVTDGARLTTDQPPAAENTIYMLGSSIVIGSWVPDRYTPASCLQRLCNQSWPGRYRVMNYGSAGSATVNDFLKLVTKPLKKGDVVVMQDLFATPKVPSDHRNSADYIIRMDVICRRNGVRFVYLRYPHVKRLVNPSPTERMLACHPFEDLLAGKTDASGYRPPKKYAEPSVLEFLRGVGVVCGDLLPHFERPHALGEVFRDDHHLGYPGHKKVAEVIHDHYLSEKAEALFAPPDPVKAAMLRLADRGTTDCFANAMQYTKVLIHKKYSNNESVREWLAGLPKPPFAGKKAVGAIVMNCNPFTNGHLHLIQTALREADGLYIFAVEEDLSVFPFADRIRLMREGTAHLADRVLVVPSGKFIISSMSFPGYFSKETKLEKIDASLDVALFGAVIAPALKITRRFVGEEPLCMVTRQYNKQMTKMLPPMGVKVRVFPRKAALDGGTPISASRVRKLMAAGDFEGIRAIVPESTFRYLSDTGRIAGAKG